MKRINFTSFTLLFCIVCFAPAIAVPADEIQTLTECTFIETGWADGDSFLVEDKNGKQFTIRLYGVDCVEYHVHDSTDARRLRAQRRYFGISHYGGSSQTSINTAKQFGAEAAAVVKQELSAPFTVQTAFADARGDGKHERFYGFVTTSTGEDLAEKLVKLGLARAYGVYRQTPDGQSRDEYRERMHDFELWAVKKGNGIWATTDWDSLPDERREDREEAAELELATATQPLDPQSKLNLNTAPRDELMRLPGVGEIIANRIIENRPYQTIDQIAEVPGIGAKKLDDLRDFLKLVD